MLTKQDKTSHLLSNLVICGTSFAMLLVNTDDVLKINKGLGKIVCLIR